MRPRKSIAEPHCLVGARNQRESGLLSCLLHAAVTERTISQSQRSLQLSSQRCCSPRRSVKRTMSYIRQHQTNGYVNGTASNQRLQRFDLAEASDTSADERSRSRPGYTHQQPEQVHGVARLDRGNARRSRDYGASASRSRSRPGARYGGAGGQVEG